MAAAVGHRGARSGPCSGQRTPFLTRFGRLILDPRMTHDPSDFALPDHDFPSGVWVGFYVMAGSNHRQEMHLSFRQGAMGGAGADDFGPFSIRGGYDAESKDVWWTKTYLGNHSVHYRGYREIKGIWGQWEIPSAATDGFHIWPRDPGDDRTGSPPVELDLPLTV